MFVLEKQLIDITKPKTECPKQQLITQIDLQIDLQRNIFKRKNRLEDTTLANFKMQLEDSLKLLANNDYALLMFKNNRVFFFCK